jgi:hypothetical protein
VGLLIEGTLAAWAGMMAVLGLPAQAERQPSLAGRATLPSRYKIPGQRRAPWPFKGRAASNADLPLSWPPDIAGYSRLMGTDEVGRAKALREHRADIDPLVASRGGRIVKTTGDGVLLAVQRLMAERNADVPEDRRMLFRIASTCAMC